MSERPRFTPQKEEEKELNIEDDTEPVSRMLIKKKIEPLLPPSAMVSNSKCLVCDNASNEDDKPFLPGANRLKKRLLNNDFVNKIFLICGKKVGLNKFRYPWEVSESTLMEFKQKIEEFPKKKRLG